MDTSPLNALDKLAAVAAIVVAGPSALWALYTIATGIAGA